MSMLGECRRMVLDAVRRWRLDEADSVTRSCAREYWRLNGVRLSRQLLELIEYATGGLGYDRDSPLDPAQMVAAGTVIAWPEVVRDNGVIVEIGTGLGRTCYVIHYVVKPLTYVTIDVSLEILAVALNANPVPDFQRCLSKPDVKVLLGDARELLDYFPKEFADHVVHDGGANPLRNPELYTPDFMRKLYRVLKPCGTISVFAGRSRSGRQLVYQSLRSAGFTGIEAVSFPDKPTFVYRARKPCEEDKA